jgi:hypothetical protein
MQDFILGQLNKFIVHYIGNKNNEDGVRFSKEETDFENIKDYIKTLLKNSFKSEELYQFYFLPDLELNPVYQFVKSIFHDNGSFIKQSQNAGQYLYDKSTHPQIKDGEFCVAYFKDCQLKDKAIDCIALFKSESKDTILKVCPSNNGIELKDEIGINTNKLDKGCLIFNTDQEGGFLLSVIDNTNRNADALYWKDEFLGIREVKNEFHQTNEFLGITKQFVTKQLKEDFEVTRTDQIDLLNRSVEYFKTHESFDKQEFEYNVFEKNDVIESFQKFDKAYRNENNVELSDNFEISSQAVKKQARVFKSVLKLDKNFHIYIHGNRELIEQGIDETGRKYYKIFYEKES